MQEKFQIICICQKKAVLLHNFLNDIHNKDYSVVKTFRVGGNSRPFCFEFTQNPSVGRKFRFFL